MEGGVVVAGNVSVPWERIDSGVYERMVAAMLSLDNPATRRVDGSGGDRGCDVAFHDAYGLHVLELKSFTGRLTSGRRKQVKRSLLRAAELQPCDWQVVLPIDPTPGEDAWFNKLVADMPFECSWRGRTWLDAKMSSRPALVRYFCGTAAEDLLAGLNELKAEQLVLANGDISAAIERLQGLASRINELNPFHRLSVQVTDGHVSVIPTPRYAGATEDYPLTIDVTFTFPRSVDGKAAEQSFRRFLSHGERVVVDRQHIESFEYSWLPGLDSSTDAFQLILDGESSWDEHGTLLALGDSEDEDSVVATLAIQFDRKRGGELAQSVTGTDASGALTVTAGLDSEAGQTFINFRFDATGVLPASALPASDMLRKIGMAAAVTVQFDNLGVTIGSVQVPADSAHQLESMGDLCRGLAQLQEVTGRYFPVPESLSDRDIADVRDANRLLAGEIVEDNWTRFVVSGAPDRVPDLLEAIQRPGQLDAMSTMYLHLGGHEIPLGAICQSYIDATVEDPARTAAAAAAAGPGDTVDVAIVPAARPGRTTRRVLADVELDALGDGD